MDDRDSMWFNRNEKLRAQSFFRRHFWKITTAGSLVLVLIFALLAFLLLAKRPANGQVTAPPTNNHQVISSQQATNTAQSNTNSPPTAAPTNPAAPASSPTPQLQGLPCKVNLSTWTDGSSDWKVLNGALLDDGTGSWDAGSGPTIVAPCDLGSTANYAVETKIQVTSSQNGACFGITGRGTPNSNGWQGYKAGVGDCYGGLDKARVSGPDYHYDSQIKDASFNPGTSVHTYRIEVKDNTIKFFIDGGLVLNMIDNRYLSGAEIGLWCQNVQLSVTSFQVTAL
jgi:hypothetical protein